MNYVTCVCVCVFLFFFLGQKVKYLLFFFDECINLIFASSGWMSARTCNVCTTEIRGRKKKKEERHVRRMGQRERRDRRDRAELPNLTGRMYVRTKKKSKTVSNTKSTIDKKRKEKETTKANRKNTTENRREIVCKAKLEGKEEKERRQCPLTEKFTKAFCFENEAILDLLEITRKPSQSLLQTLPSDCTTLLHMPWLAT
jgi:hypothetical protein